MTIANGERMAKIDNEDVFLQWQLGYLNEFGSISTSIDNLDSFMPVLIDWRKTQNIDSFHPSNTTVQGCKLVD